MFQTFFYLNYFTSKKNMFLFGEEKFWKTNMFFFQNLVKDQQKPETGFPNKTKGLKLGF